MSQTEVIVSIVIPTYNYAHFLPRALDSVLNQLSENIELVVVDDGSQDQTQEILAEYSSRNSRIKLVKQGNMGSAAARNHGIRESSGRYVLLLDADDEVLPGSLTHLIDLAESRPDAGMILGAYISVFPDGRERKKEFKPIPPKSPSETIHNYLLKKSISVSHSCSMFRKDLLLLRPYPVGLKKGEDIPVFAFLLVSAPVVVSNQTIARIHKHSDSLRHNRNDEEASAIKMVDAVFSYLPEECQHLRHRYLSQRYLSLFRSAQSAGDIQTARKYFAQAFRLSPVQALRISYLRKWLRTFTRH